MKMCDVFNSLGSASAFILLTSLLISGAGADEVTAQQCKNDGNHMYYRVRQYPEDRNATFLWMYYCEIDKINEEDIIGLPNITEIYLNHNDIASVDLAVFRHVLTLEYMSLNNNKLRELPAFPEHSCPRLTTLYLFNNQLVTLQNARTFSACTRLQILLLSNNQINYIHPDMFSSLTELERLDLDENKLSFIPEQMFANNKKLRGLFLQNNRLTYLPQEFASSFKRAGGGLDKFYFFDNPWRCTCLLELLADVQRAGARHYDYWHKYYGTWPVCVYSDAVPCRHSGLLPPPPVATGAGRQPSQELLLTLKH